MTAAGILLKGLGRVTGQVLIVGGGVAGLSLVRALRQRGIEFVVVDHVAQMRGQLSAC
jgi:NADPH-dependent 2,4-dienoyl-CoA reductase/sulfur reductase-like enzyme